MKNKGCVIAGCAGAAVVAVVIGVVMAFGGYYIYQKNQVEQKFETYQPSDHSDVPNVPPPPQTPPVEPSQPVPPVQPDQPKTPAEEPKFTWPMKQTPLNEPDQYKLVAITLAGFDQGIKSGTLRGFHQAFVANAVKPKFPAQAFDKSFQKFLTMKIDIHPEVFIQNPSFTKHRNASKDGSQIEFAGEYLARTPHGGLKVKWELSYLYEDGRGWGVTMIAVNTLPVN